MQEKFIFPPPADPRSPFRLHLAGTSYCDGNYRIHMQKHDFYFVFEYVESGSGTLEIDGRTYTPEAGDVYIVPNSGERKYRSSFKQPWVKHWFNVSGPLVAELLQLYKLENTHLVTRFSRPELFIEGLEKLRKNPEKAHLPLGPDILGSIIAQLADDVLSRSDDNLPASEEGRKLRDFLEKQISREMPSLEAMGKLLARSSVQTIRIFRRDFGETPYQYLLKRKLIAAGELLQCTRRTVKQISADLCFDNEYYFARLFKKKIGYSPGLYRKLAREGKVIKFAIIEDNDGELVNTIFTRDADQ